VLDGHARTLDAVVRDHGDPGATSGARQRLAAMAKQAPKWFTSVPPDRFRMPTCDARNEPAFATLARELSDGVARSKGFLLTVDQSARHRDTMVSFSWPRLDA
jgi:hypothetical protein